jgi:hypothetical protein
MFKLLFTAKKTEYLKYLNLFIKQFFSLGIGFDIGFGIGSLFADTEIAEILISANILIF